MEASSLRSVFTALKSFHSQGSPIDLPFCAMRVVPSSVMKVTNMDSTNPRGLWAQGSVKIVALGDSFTHGYCVPDDKNFIALVRRVHPGTLNLGMAGDGPL